MEPWDVLELRSEATEQDLRVSVAWGGPGSPVVYLIDPSFFWGIATGTATLFRSAAALTGGGFPGLTVVGIGYPTEDPEEVFVRRARDLTPTDGRATTSTELPPVQFGGADRFLEALADEVIALVESRYEVDATKRCLSGFSFGGLFGLYVLFHRPGLFSRYLLGSPSLWWDDRLAFEWEGNWAASHDELEARVFLSVGGSEQTVGDSWKNEGMPTETLQAMRQVDRLTEMADRLEDRGYRGLRLDTVVFDDEYHFTSPPAAMSRGLLALFES